MRHLDKTQPDKMQPDKKRGTRVMAILNLTPDSFSDGGVYYQDDADTQKPDVRRIVRRVEQLLAEGFDPAFDILDVGGESTRPGAIAVPENEELERVLPAIAAIQKSFPDICLSIDTRKASVAQAALKAGASIVNDVSGFRYDAAMLATIAEADCDYVLTHSIGTPETMQVLCAQADEPVYPEGVEASVIRFFACQIDAARAAGVAAENIILDPGLGFGKTQVQNLQLLAALPRIKTAFPAHRLLIGASRKSFLSLGNPTLTLAERDALSAAVAFNAVVSCGGVDILRVHSLPVHLSVIQLTEALAKARRTEKNPAGII